MHPLHHRPGDQGRRDDREGELKQRHGAMAELAIAIGRRPIAEARPLETPNERRQGAAALRESQAVAKQHPEHTHQGHGSKAHHHGVEHVAAAHKPRIEEGQGWRHHQHQGRTEQHEAVVGALQSLGCRQAGIPRKHSHGQGRDQI